MGCSVLCWAFQGSLCRSLGFWFCATLSSPVLGPVNSRPLGSPWLSAPFPQFMKTAGFHWGFLFCGLGSLWRVVWGCHPQGPLFGISLLEVIVLYFFICNVFKTTVSYSSLLCVCVCGFRPKIKYSPWSSKLVRSMNLTLL